MKKIRIYGFIILSLLFITGCVKKNDVKIVPNETKRIELETYQNDLFSMQIPKGWQVEVGVFDAVHFTFMAFDPKEPSYKIYFNMKSEGFLKTQEMKDWYSSMYQSSMSELPVIDPQTTEQFYKVFTEAFTQNNTDTFIFPSINDFSVVESLGTNTTGGEIVRATYFDEAGRKIDGIFTATIKEVSLYYITALNVYNTIFFTTPEDKLTEWEPILNNCVSTIEFTDQFISNFNNQEETLMATIAANQRIYDQISNIITEGWNARQSTYDIISQKQSDSTLGYERVYDTETGDIYKAYNGFMDDYQGERYQTIDDAMYNLPTSGYIEK